MPQALIAGCDPRRAEASRHGGIATWIWLDVYGRDPDEGTRLGYCVSVAIRHGAETIIDTTGHAQALHIGSDHVIVGDLSLPHRGHRVPEWQDVWTYQDRVLVTTADVARLLTYLRDDHGWYYDHGETGLVHDWLFHTPLVSADIERALRETT